MRPSFNRCDIYAARPTEREGQEDRRQRNQVVVKGEWIPVFQPSKVGKEERLEIQAINPSYSSNGLWVSLSQKLLDVPPKGV